MPKILSPVLCEWHAGKVAWWCQPCNHFHHLNIGGNGWSWNGDAEHPSFQPSVLCDMRPLFPKCHSFVTEGMVQYLPDCSHALAGTTVPLAPLPEWAADHYMDPNE